MSSGTQWTPLLIAQRLAAAHRRWERDPAAGKAVGCPLNPTFLKKIGERQVYDQNRDNGMFALGLARLPAHLQKAWSPRIRRPWTTVTATARLRALYIRWLTDAARGRRAGGRWCRAYLDATDHAYVRSVERLGMRLNDLATRAGGEVRAFWVPTVRRVHKPACRRTVGDVAKALAALHRVWEKDTDHGKPAGRPFGPVYLRIRGEQRLDAWMRRNGGAANVLGFVPKIVARSWMQRVTA